MVNVRQSRLHEELLETKEILRYKNQYFKNKWDYK